MSKHFGTLCIKSLKIVFIFLKYIFALLAIIYIPFILKSITLLKFKFKNLDCLAQFIGNGRILQITQN